MELRHIRYFCAIAENHSMSRAAEIIPLAQPALSRQMRDLEDELGAKLFIRSSTGVRLTDAGVVFYQHATKLLLQASIAVSAVQELAKGKGGEFIVGGDWRIPLDLVPKAIKGLRERFPKVSISLRDLPIHEQMTALRERKIHIGFLPANFMGLDEGMESLCLMHSRLCAILPSSHRLAKRSLIQAKEIEDDPWIIEDDRAAPGTRELYKKGWKMLGINPRISATAMMAEGVIARVASGEGVSVTPEIMQPMPSQLIAIVPLDMVPFELHAVWPKEAASPLIPTLLTMLRGMIPAMAAKV
jgi:LysR family transcriptional regulator, benzoate and cis,cis-muconate-responsive activator of ben and cat genes